MSDATLPHPIVDAVPGPDTGRGEEKLLDLQALAPRYRTNAVLEWNTAALDTALIDSQQPAEVVVNGVRVSGRDQDGPTRASRALAIVHAAIFNTVVGIQGGYQPYRVSPPPLPDGVDVDLAVAAAARRALRELYPRQQVRLNDLFSHSLRTFQRENPVRDPLPSRRYGAEVARRLLEDRSGDGSNVTETYAEAPRVGIWRADPLDPQQRALTPRWGRVRPFVLTSAAVTAFTDPARFPAPPGWKTTGGYNFTGVRLYADAVEEVKRLGAANSTVRTTDQTLNAIFWSYDGGRGTPVRLYNQVARAALLRKPLDPRDTARLLLQVNLALADAAIATWRVKYHYDLWRPVHAIRFPDGTADTVPDPDWIPLGKQLPYATVEHCSPPFPAYTSGHAGLGSATFRVLRETFGNDFEFELTSDELPGYARRYTTFEKANEDNGRSRIYLGVHFVFDDVNGRELGRRIGEAVVRYFASPPAPVAGSSPPRGTYYEEDVQTDE